MKKNLVSFLSVTTAFAVYGGVIGAGVPGADRVERVRPGAAVQGGAVAAGAAASAQDRIERMIKSKSEKEISINPEKLKNVIEYCNQLSEIARVKLGDPVLECLYRMTRLPWDSLSTIAQGIHNFRSRVLGPRADSWFSPYVYII